MADVLNRTTNIYIPSANTPDYPISEWIHNPDLTAVQGYPSQYWVITGDVVTLMSPSERAAVDQQVLNASRDYTAGRFDDIEDITRAYGAVALDEFNLHASTVTAILNAVDAATSLADLKNRVATIADLPQRTLKQVQSAVRNKLGT